MRRKRKEGEAREEESRAEEDCLKKEVEDTAYCVTNPASAFGQDAGFVF